MKIPLSILVVVDDISTTRTLGTAALNEIKLYE